MIITGHKDYLDIKDSVATEFVKNEINKYIATISNNLPINLFLMDEYLRKEYNLSLCEALSLINNNLTVMHDQDNQFKIWISEEVRYNQTRLADIAKLINLGNLSIRGTHLIENIYHYALSKM